MAVAKNEEPGGLKECDMRHYYAVLGFPIELFKLGAVRINGQGRNGEEELF